MIIPDMIQKYYNGQNIHFVELVKEWIIENVKKHQYQVIIDRLEEHRSLSTPTDLGVWNHLNAKYIGIIINNNQTLKVQEINKSGYKTNYDIKNFTLNDLKEAIKGFYKDSSK